MKFRIRPWELSDVQSLAEHANNIKIWRNVRDYFPYPYTEKDAEAYIQMVLKQEGNPVNFAIDIDGKAVGGVGIIPCSDVERISAEIGYWLGEEYWGNGIVTEVVRQLSAYAFEYFPLTKIFAVVFEHNEASKAVLRKAGYELEAILKRAAIKEGQTIDLYYYSLFKD